MAFEPIHPQDFLSFTPGKVATYIEIEKLLNEIGGGGEAGVRFKRAAMKAAGWPYDGLTGYAKNAELAATAFNKVIQMLEQTRDQQELMDRLSTD